jgi:hypothetical protein
MSLVTFCSILGRDRIPGGGYGEIATVRGRRCSPNLVLRAWAADLPFGGQPQAGVIGSSGQSNSYALAANANDVVNFTMVDDEW